MGRDEVLDRGIGMRRVLGFYSFCHVSKFRKVRDDLAEFFPAQLVLDGIDRCYQYLEPKGVGFTANPVTGHHKCEIVTLGQSFFHRIDVAHKPFYKPFNHGMQDRIINGLGRSYGLVIQLELILWFFGRF